MTIREYALLDRDHRIPRYRKGMYMPGCADREISAATKARHYLALDQDRLVEVALNLEENLLVWQARALNAVADRNELGRRCLDLEAVLATVGTDTPDPALAEPIADTVSEPLPDELEDGDDGEPEPPAWDVPAWVWGLIAGMALMYFLLTLTGGLK